MLRVFTFLALFALPVMASEDCLVDVSEGLTAKVLLQLKTCEEPVLIRGTVADPKYYPTVVWIGNCTATLIGPRTLITAAHCTTRAASFTVGASRYTSACVGSGFYPRNSTSDYYICYTNRAVDLPFYESLEMDASKVKVGDWVQLSGFGCQSWGGRLDGQYRVGRARVSRVLSGSNNDVVAGNGATLCSGDSGGPAWTLKANGDRDKIFGVNSRSDTRVTSFISSYFTSNGKSNISDYLNRYPSAKICGVHADAPKCREAKPLEPVKFVVDVPKTMLEVIVQPIAKYTPAFAKEMFEMVLGGEE